MQSKKSKKTEASSLFNASLVLFLGARSEVTNISVVLVTYIKKKISVNKTCLYTGTFCISMARNSRTYYLYLGKNSVFELPFMEIPESKGFERKSIFWRKKNTRSARSSCYIYTVWLILMKFGTVYILIHWLIFKRILTGLKKCNLMRKSSCVKKWNLNLISKKTSHLKIN